jgi:diguanylate cyclase (GGDEF)-like protein
MQQAGESLTLNTLFSRQYSHHIILVVIAALGIYLSLSAYSRGSALQEQLRHKEFERLAQVQALRAQQFIDNARGLLNAFRGLFIASEELTREEYHRFVTSVIASYPEITAVHWAPRVPHARRAMVEAELAAEGLAPMGIFDTTPDADDMHRAPERELYFPILFAAPERLNSSVAGLDALNRPHSAPVVRQVLSRGQQASSPPFHIVQDPQGPLAIAIYQPLYALPGVPESKEVQGLVILMLRPEILLRELIEDGELNSGLRLLDVTEEPARSIYPGSASPSAAGPGELAFPLELPGRSWQLVLSPSEQFLGASRSRQPLWLMLVSLLLTAVLMAFVARSLRDARMLAQANTSLLLRQQELDALAYYDTLTGLPNRSLLVDRVNQALFADQRRGSFSAIGLLDLDGFKEVNDSLGHQAGDEVLARLARRMTRVLRSTDTLARIGGDEFVVLLPGLRGRELAEQILQRLLDEIARPVVLERGDRVGLSASIGMVLPCDAGQELETWLGQADRAMYRAKHAGKGHYVIVPPQGSGLLWP